VSTFVTILTIGERVEAFVDSEDARTAERAYLLQGVKQRQLHVTTVQVNPSSREKVRASCPCGATGDPQSIAEHISSGVCPEGDRPQRWNPDW
jgi:hypothetical protein